MSIAEEAVNLAAQWQNRANRLLTPEERAVREKLERLLSHPSDKVVMAKMIDQCFRCRDEGRVADQIHYLFREYGVPDFFSTGDKILSRLFMGIGRHFPHASVPRVIERIREESRRSVIPGEPEALGEYLHRRKKEGVRVNLNHLGEAVLGEKEARSRLDAYMKTLQDPDIEHISVKISTLCSRIEPLAFEQTVNVLRDRLSILYRAAAEHGFVGEDGSRKPKFVHLDMEEYRDLSITAEAFKQTLDMEEFRDLSAGIALQAYLPDSLEMQKELTSWARKRVAAGGAPIRIRIVKGANLEMERVEASLRGWPLAPYDNKLSVDANYRRMVESGMIPENIRAVRLGVASHNLFELAYAYLLARENGVTAHFSFEMLEGMADHVRRALAKTSVETVVYAPVATREGFVNAIAYLMRRLDENTSEENFLRYSTGLEPDTPPWESLKDRFIASQNYRDRAGTGPHRVQDRTAEAFSPKTDALLDGEFANEADTDWSLQANRQWAEGIRARWKKDPGQSPVEVPVVAGGRELFAEREHRRVRDRSRPEAGAFPACYALADESDIEGAVSTAREDPDGWRGLCPEKRHRILSGAASEIRRYRGDLMGAAAADTGKIFAEADPEVSEAVDFTEFYPLSVNAFCGLKNLRCRGKGVGVVISPWNFPISIPCSGIAASLAAGNTVIFKPSSDAVLTGWILCRCFWNAGVPKTALQFVPFSGSSQGDLLTGHPGVDYVILTGGTETGLAILQKRPGIHLAAETGGKNATIVTAMSDRDQAIGHVIRAAFGNSGQKCSATSLLILEKEVYEDGHFKEKLKDAAESIPVGSAWDFKNQMGPLIRPPEGKLKRGLEALEPGESWLLEPENRERNPYLWTPGIKWGVRPGSFTHMTELFGPVLAVMCADDLDEAIELANATGYGLTSGLESLDRREQEKWKDRILAGTLYINRPTTGAVVLRQPFGGMGKSALGPGIKVGGPNYVAQLMEISETGPPPAGAVRKDHPLLRLAREWERKLRWGGFGQWEEDLAKTVRAVKSYLLRAEEEFLWEKDYFHLRGQDNIVRYLPVGTVMVRVHEKDSLYQVLARIAAAKIAGCSPVVSIPPSLENGIPGFLEGTDGKKLAGDIPTLEQSDEALADAIPDIDRIRYAAPDRVAGVVFRKAAETGFYISRVPVMMEGRIELLQYFREQSVCDNYHRYGNLGERA